MAAPRRTSRKRSAANSGSTPPDLAHVFFIDRSLGQKIIAERVRQCGVRVEIHDQHFPQNALDEEWLTEVGRRGWIVLTKDDRIRYRSAELEAYRRNKVRVFIFGSGQMKAPAKNRPYRAKQTGAFLCANLADRVGDDALNKRRFLGFIVRID